MYILEEAKLRENLRLIAHVQRESGAEIILALKAFALWKTFPIFREYIGHTTASSLNEARISAEAFGGRCHTYAPAYEEQTFDDILKYSEHVTFNSLSQFHRFSPRVTQWNAHHANQVSMGLRINPEYAEIETDLYNPCAPGSRLGVLQSQLPAELPAGLDGLHFHCLCENDATSLQKVLMQVEQKFRPWLQQAKWLNMGGGHLMTRQGYHVGLLIDLLKEWHRKFPNLKIILEPGSAFLWGTGYLTAKVLDIVENHGIRTAVLNTSFACHMPDCLEMPYQPNVRGAQKCDTPTGKNTYRLGGNSCLSGDFIGYWCFEQPLHVGQEIIFEDMIHYTTVKTHMFNGVDHPPIAMMHEDGRLEILRRFTYEDYKSRMD
ncbi:MAG: carboxynorspermidine decarboxylase [Bacteroidaceae bacterium]|nr:carboxynorspermidine decarboxylase [Bacteroidaceae bacterium]